MATTDVLPSALTLDRAEPVHAWLRPASHKPTLLRRIFDTIVEVQTLRARREITRHLGALGIRPTDNL